MISVVKRCRRLSGQFASLVLTLMNECNSAHRFMSVGAVVWYAHR